jgi:hypothetical protein
MKPIDYIPIRKFAKKKNISWQWVYDLIREGKLHTIKIVDRLYILNDDLAKSYQKVKK